MINTVAYLLAISISGMFKLRARYDRIGSWLMFFIMAFLFINAYNQTAYNQLYGFSILWGETQLGDIKLDFHPTSVTNLLILPVFFISLWAVLNNNLFRTEEKRCPFNSCIILNFIALSMMFCATNYVQLITMVFVSDIIGYILIKNIKISKSYVVYNFFADMCLFMILALACGKIQSIDITRLLGYEEIGKHKDFVGLVTALALFMKIGCFPLQGYLTELSSARFPRMVVINLLGSPLSGLLLLLKLQNLLLVSNLSLPLYKIIAASSFIIGVAGVIIKRKLEIKTIYFNMAGRSLLLIMLLFNHFNWNINLSIYIVLMYLFNQLFFEIYLCLNHSTNLSVKGKINERNIKQLRVILIEEAISLSLLGLLFWQICKGLENQNILYATASLILAVCICLNQIYNKIFFREFIFERQRIFITSTFICLVVLGIIAHIIPVKSTIIVVLSILFLGKMALPWHKLLNIDKENSHKRDKTKKIWYESYLQSINKLFIGLLEMFFIEKSVTKGISFIDKQIAVFFLKLNKKNNILNVLGVAAGCIIFIIAFLKGFK